MSDNVLNPNTSLTKENMANDEVDCEDVYGGLKYLSRDFPTVWGWRSISGDCLQQMHGPMQGNLSSTSTLQYLTEPCEVQCELGSTTVLSTPNNGEVQYSCATIF